MTKVWPLETTAGVRGTEGKPVGGESGRKSGLRGAWGGGRAGLRQRLQAHGGFRCCLKHNGTPLCMLSHVSTLVSWNDHSSFSIKYALERAKNDVTEAG